MTPRSSTFTAAVSAHQAGRLSEAKRLYAEVLSREPNNITALNLLGVLLHQEGDSRQAIESIEKALALNPGYAEAHFNLGIVLIGQGRLEEAVAACHKALSLKPGYAEASYNLGIALKELGRLEEAVAAYRQALKINPGYAEAQYNLSVALIERGRFEEAVTACQQALTLQPGFAEAHNNLGIALMGLGRPEDAIEAFQKAFERKPDYAEAQSNLGNALRVQGKLEQAVTACRVALALNPGFAEAHYNLGFVLEEQGKLEESVEAYQKAVTVNPDFAEAYNNLGNALKDQGRLEEAVAACRKALERKPGHTAAHSNLICFLNYDAGFSQQDIYAESRRWDRTHAVPHGGQPRSHGNDRDPERRLHVGYLSPDLREHSVSYFMDPLMACRDRRSFEVFCYADVVKLDRTTARFRDLADAWRSTVGMTDSAVAERVREDGIDILVDLAGHTANNRLLVFAERAAPVQVTWLGYANTTGLSAMDYRLTDAIADPEGAADGLYSETLLRLPNGFLCFAPAAEAPEIGQSPALVSGHITFGSFNALSKVTPEVVETWARILDSVPRSRLLMKSRQLADAGTRNRYLDMFTALGIDAGRVEVCSWIASRSGHLGAYGRVDIGLDPFPYNGTTTSCEALWLGVPVITLRGDRHSGRVGASLLTRIALTDLIAETKDSYVEIAVGLANTPGQLAKLREGLRHRMRESPLCDAAAFTRDVESAYREMWRQWCHRPAEGDGS